MIHAMRPRLPLFAKIVLWFFLNLVVVALVAWIVFRVQLRSGFDSVLADHIGTRVEGVCRAVIAEIEQRPRAEWDDLLVRCGAEHGVKFFVISQSEGTLAGERIEIPDEVRLQLPRGGHRSDGERPGGGDGFRKGPPGRKGFGGKKGGPPREDGDGFEGPPPEGRGGPPGMDSPSPVHRRFLVRSRNPDAYWVGLLIGLRSADSPRPGPAVILVRSETFSAGGLFFDFKPWLLAGGGVVLLSALIWLPFVGSMTRSVSQMTRATEQIADGRFDVRVDERRRDELGQLGGSINRLGGRLGDFVTGQKRFLGDIAHELCSPISRLQMAIGILEQRADEKQKPYVDDLREEAQHMSDLVNELLSFSKASLKPGEVQLTPVNLFEIAEQAAKRESAGATEVKISVPLDLTVLANADLLQRAVSNLVRNALRYAGHAGPVSISTQRHDSSIAIIVADRGAGIPEQHLGRIFETFYRIEPHRARESGGVGLGLAIVKACVEACNGTVRARNRHRGGLKVIIVLPEAPAASLEAAPATPPAAVPAPRVGAGHPTPETAQGSDAA